MKWMNCRIAIALIASVGLVLGAGCSDDDVTNGGGSENGEDVIDDTDDDREDTVDDVEDVDATDDVEDVSYEPDVEVVECAYPSTDPNCPQGDFGTASFFSEFVIETRGQENACCFDISQDEWGFIDNMIGEELVPVMSAIPEVGDVNHNIAAAIDSGDLTYLLEAAHWEHPEWDSDIELTVYRGGSSETSGEENIAGKGEFTVAADNFEPNGEPRFGFEQASVVDGKLIASDGFISITMPGLIDGVVALLGDVQLTGDIVENPAANLEAGGSFGLENGKLGGALLRDRFFHSINTLSYECDCLDLDIEDPDNPDVWTEGLFEYRENSDSWSCEIKAESGENFCQSAMETTECRALGHQQMCNALGLVSQNPDVEVDGEAAFSIGVRFESVTAEIIGIEDDE